MRQPLITWRSFSELSCYLYTTWEQSFNHPIRRGGTKFVLNLAEEINDITLALEGIQVNINSLLKEVMIDIIVLDFLLASKIFATAKTSTCT